MNIPIAPVKTKLLDQEGTLNVSWLNHHNQMSQQLSYYLGNEGYLLPQMTTDKLSSIKASKSTSIAYDNVKKRAVVNNDGEYENIATDPKQLTTAEMTAWAALKDSDGKFINNGKSVYDITVDKTYVVNNGVPKEVT